MNRATSAEEYKQISSFQAVSKLLGQERFADRMERPLAFWAMPNDRRLPLAFLGRPLHNLLSTPFEDLAGTPGVGRKKIGTMLQLLHRATKDHPPAMPYSGTGTERKSTGSRASRQDGAIRSQCRLRNSLGTVAARPSGNITSATIRWGG